MLLINYVLIFEKFKFKSKDCVSSLFTFLTVYECVSAPICLPISLYPYNIHFRFLLCNRSTMIDAFCIQLTFSIHQTEKKYLSTTTCLYRTSKILFLFQVARNANCSKCSHVCHTINFQCTFSLFSFLVNIFYNGCTIFRW